MNNSSIYPPPQAQVCTTTGTSINLGPITTGTGGQFLVSNGTSPVWNDPISILGNTSPGVLQIKGDAVFEGDIKLNGKSLDKTLTKLEERLAILHPNEKLEVKWKKLRELRKQYMELEADILEKEQIIEILKR
jgi:hypothetical protein